ncbi:3'-5' exonuclease [Antribacter sp. KLBMP9083]|uniref:3'-5' exonuclease n=1 Tax=Antribacter soli TaxID=2910976 RepID=A0AA41QF68_9MICO|nr:3'-5' exonuclease [Antribacter soli]MCF4122018.1 3'-5' exonuclease [Antribacter soli]
MESIDVDRPIPARWDALDYVVVDVEGNGAYPPELVEVAVVPVRRGSIGGPRAWLVRPPSPITWQARRVHGITNQDVASAPRIDHVAGEVLAALGVDGSQAAVVGHNVRVDLDVLTRSLPGWTPVEVFDTLRLSRHLWNLPSHSLGALVRTRHLDHDLPAGLRPHRAAYDALVTARLFVDLMTSAAVDGLGLSALRAHGAVSTLPAHREVLSDSALFDLP